ncbi:MAG TPA: GspE/PulE family protein, partial [Acidimicrobiia bacterium]
VHGEKIVLRILDKGTALLRLGELGFLPETLDRFADSYRKPYGTILVTGPTGSGKSTTLYATLNILNQPDRNIITVEDPVEYRLAGINQVQVHPKAGLTFAAALRSILRSDPDIVLVGEIRDRETAVIAIEAALTGHLVLSTLHTNDAASTPMRLVEMGVEPFLVTSALDCIVAQRLARKLCDKCKEPYSPTEAEMLQAGWDVDALDDWPTVYRAIGCGACGRTGYRGRFGIHEVMMVTEDVERAILERRSSEDIAKLAVMQGMLSLRQDGLRKVGLGMTSFEEIFRVVA